MPMNSIELQQVVDAIIGNRRLGNLRPHELLESIHRKRKFPTGSFSIIEPLLHITDGATYKYAIDIIGKINNGTSNKASDAIEAAWERSWEHGVPQACNEAFCALIRIGDNENRLLVMIEKAMNIDNYGIHKECAEALMKITGGASLLANWGDTIAGKCDCHLHQKLTAKINQYLKSKEQ